MTHAPNAMCRLDQPKE